MGSSVPKQTDSSTTQSTNRQKSPDVEMNTFYIHRREMSKHPIFADQMTLRRSKRTRTKNRNNADFNLDHLRPPRDPDLINCIKNNSKRRKAKEDYFDRITLVRHEVTKDAAAALDQLAAFKEKEFEKRLRRLQRRVAIPEQRFPAADRSVASKEQQFHDSVSPEATPPGPIRGDHIDASGNVSVDKRVNRLRRYISRLIMFDSSPKANKTRDRYRSTSSQGEGE